MADKVDLRQLIQDRKQGEVRGTVKHRICLDPDLLPELAELEAEREAQSGDDAPRDARYGGGRSLSSQIKNVEARIAEVSVVAVFRLPSRKKLSEYTQRVQDGDGDDNELDPDIARECFDHFESLTGDRIADLGQEQFDDLVEVTATGEVNSIGNKIYRRSMGAPDFPRSALPSGTARK